MGAVTNMRPELFRAVLAEVPFVDVVNTMLDASLPLTVIEYDEWGNPNDPAAYAYIRSYSPYDNIAAQDYPHMLVTAGLNDPRVAYWEPAKWTAKLRAKKTDGNRLLLRTNMGAGHGEPPAGTTSCERSRSSTRSCWTCWGSGKRPHQNGDRGRRRASSESSPKVRPAAPRSNATEIRAKAASLLDGLQNHCPFANM